MIQEQQQQQQQQQQQPRLEASNYLPQTPPDSPNNNDYQEYTFMRRATSRGTFGMMETITEHSEESESNIQCEKERDGRDDEIAASPPSLSNSDSSTTATTAANVSRPSTRHGRDPGTPEPLSGIELEPLSLDDWLNMQAYLRAMAIYGGGAPERSSSIPTPIRAATHKGSIGSLATVLTTSTASSLGTGISTDITATQESTVSGRLRQELDLMVARGGAMSGGPGSQPATSSDGNAAGLSGTDTSSPLASLASRSGSPAGTSTIIPPRPEVVVPEAAISEPKPGTTNDEAEDWIPKNYLEGKWHIPPKTFDDSVLTFLQGPTKAEEEAAAVSGAERSKNGTKLSSSTIGNEYKKIDDVKGGGIDENGELTEPLWGHSSALHDNVRRWYVEEVLFTRMVAIASTTIPGKSDLKFLFVPESVRAEIRRLGDPLIQFGYEIQKYCLEYVEGYDLSWVISQWQQCQEGREDATHEGKTTKKPQRDSAIEMGCSDARPGSPDCGCPLDRSCPHAGSSTGRSRQQGPTTPPQLQLPPVVAAVSSRTKKPRNAALTTIQGGRDDRVPVNEEAPGPEANTRSDTPSSTSTAMSGNTHAISTASAWRPGPPRLKPRPRPLTDEEEDQLIRAINAVVTGLTHMRDSLNEIHSVLSATKVMSRLLPTPESREESQKQFRRLYGELVPPIPRRMNDLLALMEEKTDIIASILDDGRPDGGGAPPGVARRQRQSGPGRRTTMAGGLGPGSPTRMAAAACSSCSPSSPKAPPPQAAGTLRAHIHHLLHTSQKTYTLRLAYAHAHLYALQKLYSCPMLDSFTYRSLPSLEARLERLRQQDRVHDGAGSLCAMSHSVLSMAQGIQKRRGGRSAKNKKAAVIAVGLAKRKSASVVVSCRIKGFVGK
ncbi:hypothetical protein QBC36DRAFT_238139 [Triangularia setosa]|uniref:Uncharacterized protein n=1 Tax=Triangularia setosa TaxID=2587417 RepID=A0AAN6W7G3_9PEZI|nr:hypothetical protein QBC36DRAFT_238139 [Podospora setosa]